MATREEDLYAVLQVPPAASLDEIDAAYARLQALYSSERLASGPAEFQALAARRREELSSAYAVLADPRRRARYDRSRAASDAPEMLDYRPLPPARRQERPSPSIPLPPVEVAAYERRIGSPPRPRGPAGRMLVIPLLVGAGVLGVLLLLVLSGVRTQSGRAALATPVLPGFTPVFTQAQIDEARTKAEGSTDPSAWITLGNMLLDNMSLMRERAPVSPQYLGALPQWLEAAEAYGRALDLGAGEAARADRAAALFYFGIGANQPERVSEAVAEAERARDRAPDDPRVLLRYGSVLVGLNPPREAEALSAWRRLVEVAPGSREALRAKELLAAYGQ